MNHNIVTPWITLNVQNTNQSGTRNSNSYNNSAYSNNAYNNVNLLSGQQTTAQQFKHNNMQPYFGAKIRGPSVDINNTESIMDTKQGAGSQNFSKAEIAPLFRPDENSHHPNGTPNNSDFFQSRMNESMKMSLHRVKMTMHRLLEEERLQLRVVLMVFTRPHELFLFSVLHLLCRKTNFGIFLTPRDQVSMEI
jgi:hypothetical protein